MMPHYAAGLRIIDLLVKTTLDELTVSGLEHLGDHPRTLYVSNHADIVREAAFLNHLLGKQKLPLAYLGAGENLFRSLFIRPLLTLQPIFPIPRGKGKGRDIAAVINDLLDEHPVWIAQSGGRSKDGDFHTHPSLIANLAYTRGSGVERYAQETRIIPVAVSTEYEPAAAILARNLLGEKSCRDDLRSVLLGIFSYKGRGHVGFAAPIQARGNGATDVTDEITHAILANYRCYGTNEEAYAERSRFPMQEWLSAPVDISRINDKRLVKQITTAEPRLQPYIAARYAMPERNRRLIERDASRVL